MLSRVVFIILHWTLLVLADSRTTSALDITIYSNNVRYAASRRGRGRDELPWKIRNMVWLMQLNRNPELINFDRTTRGYTCTVKRYIERVK